MLRWVVGDDNFYQACYNYLHLPQTDYGFGRTRDLQNEMESVSGKDLDEFFAIGIMAKVILVHTSMVEHLDSIGFIIHQETSTRQLISLKCRFLPGLSWPNTYEFVCNNTQQDQGFVFYKGMSIVTRSTLISINGYYQKITRSRNHSLTSRINPASRSKDLAESCTALTIDSPVPFTKVQLINSQGSKSVYQLKEHQVILANLRDCILSDFSMKG
jgi:hypothetical protein